MAGFTGLFSYGALGLYPAKPTYLPLLLRTNHGSESQTRLAQRPGQRSGQDELTPLLYNGIYQTGCNNQQLTVVCDTVNPTKNTKAVF
jgi:hypothetical protein